MESFHQRKLPKLHEEQKTPELAQCLLSAPCKAHYASLVPETPYAQAAT